MTLSFTTGQTVTFAPDVIEDYRAYYDYDHGMTVGAVSDDGSVRVIGIRPAGAYLEGSERSMWVNPENLIPTDLTPETATTVDLFKRLVVQEALKRQEQHSLCGELQVYLKDGLGLADYMPKRRVTIQTVIEVEATGSEYNDQATALYQAQSNGVPASARWTVANPATA